MNLQFMLFNASFRKNLDEENAYFKFFESCSPYFRVGPFILFNTSDEVDYELLGIYMSRITYNVILGRFKKTSE